MSLLKALVGGIIGGTIGAYLADLIHPTLQSPGHWTVLIAGLLAGLGTRMACHGNRDFVTGVMASVATIVAISGVSYVTSNQAAKSAERSMATIPVKTDFRDEREASPDLTGENSQTVDESADPLAERNDQDSTTSETSRDQNNQPGDEANSSEQASTDQQPAETGPSVDPWVSEVPVTAGRGATATFPKSLLVFQILSALLAFLLGTGSASVANSARQRASTTALDNDRW